MPTPDSGEGARALAQQSMRLMWLGHVAALTVSERAAEAMYARSHDLWTLYCEKDVTAVTTTNTTIVNQAVVDTTTGEIMQDYSQSQFVAAHINFDNTVRRVTYALNLNTPEGVNEATSVTNAVWNDFRIKSGFNPDVSAAEWTAFWTAFNTTHTAEAAIALTLFEACEELRTQRRQARELKREIRWMLKASRNIIPCHKPTAAGYKGCGGLGEVIDRDGKTRTCTVCGGSGEIERADAARTYLEAFEEQYGSLAVALKTKRAQLAANPFSGIKEAPETAAEAKENAEQLA